MANTDVEANTDIACLQVIAKKRVIAKNREGACPPAPLPLKSTPVKLAESAKKNSSNIVISSLVTREDDYKTKADEVNKTLQEIFGKKGIPLIRNNNINSERALNSSILHLNDIGVSVIVRNFKTFLTNFERQTDQGIQNDKKSNNKA